MFGRPIHAPMHATSYQGAAHTSCTSRDVSRAWTSDARRSQRSLVAATCRVLLRRQLVVRYGQRTRVIATCG